MQSSKKQRILAIGKFGTEQLGLHVAETLESMGHEVARFRPGIKRIAGGKLAQTWTKLKNVAWRFASKIPPVRKTRRKRLFNRAKQFEPDVVLECGSFLYPDEIDRIKGLTDAKCALWFPDSVAGFGGHKFLLGDYDALFFKDPYIVRALQRRLGISAFYLPECFNPDRHRVPDQTEETSPKWTCDIATAGSMYPYRAKFFEQLSAYDVQIWGNQPPVWLDLPPSVKRMQRTEFVADGEKAQAFTGAKIVVNNLLPTEVWGVNARTFEAAGVGAFQLMDRQAGLSQLYEEGKEVACFEDHDELITKIEYYLEHDAERRSIAEAARERSLSEHTYKHRLVTLLNTLDGEIEGFPMPSIEWHEELPEDRLHDLSRAEL